MRKILVCLLVVSLSVSILEASANAARQTKKQEVVTNSTIIKMVKAKFGEALIISKINASKTNFDLSTDAIIELKESGVSEKVIGVMMGTDSASSPQKDTEAVPPRSKNAKLSKNDVAMLPAIGDFFLLKNGKLIEIEEHPGYQQAANIAKAIFSFGLASDIRYVIESPKSKFRISASKENLVFISKIKIDPVGIQGGDLFKLAIEDTKLRYMLMSCNPTSPGAGTTYDEYKTNYEFQRNPDGTYKITTKEPLPPGEYAFMMGSTKEVSVRVFDFGIDPES